METARLYTDVAKHNVSALTLLTILDSLIAEKSSTSKGRENSF